MSLGLIKREVGRVHDFVHVEIPVKDIKRAKAFYGKVFGWTFQDFGRDYAIFMPPGGGVGGGLMKVKKVTAKPVVHVYINVEDLEAKMKEIRKARGKALGPKNEVPNMGWWAKFADNQGAVLFLWQRTQPPRQPNLPV